MNAKNAIALAMLAMLSTLGCASAQNFLMTGKFEAPIQYQLQDAAQVHSPDGCEACASGGHTVPGYVSVKHSEPPLKPMEGPQQRMPGGPGQSLQQASAQMPVGPGGPESMYR